MTKWKRYKNKYRGLTTRAAWWDYGGDAIYHIEIGLRDGECWFGEIENGVMKLSKAGKIAQSEWLSIPEKFTYVSLDEFVIMPNHVHGIVVLKMEDGQPQKKLGSSKSAESPAMNRTIPELNQGVTGKGGVTGDKNPMLSENLGRCMRWYKAPCTFQIRAAFPNFKWHPKFWDNIILSDKELQIIRKYIQDNPINWKCRRYFPR